MTLQNTLPFKGLVPGDVIIGPVTCRQEEEIVEQTKWYNKDIVWLNHAPDTWGRSILRKIEKIVLFTSVIGIPKLLVNNKIEDKMKKLRAFHKFVEQKKAPETQEPVWLKDHEKKQATGPFFEFVIFDELIWARRKGVSGKFFPVFWDGFQEGVPVQVDTDGKNFIVVCRNKKNEQEFHYSKFAVSKISYENDGKIVYSYMLKQEFQDWIPEWFTREGISTKFANFIFGKRLKLPFSCGNNEYLWSCSERSHFAQNKFEDGVTSIYIYDNKRNVISLYDPWMPKWVQAYIPLPRRFKLLSLDAAGSTLFILGWKYQIINGKPLRFVKAYTFGKADVTQLGWNPDIKGTYDVSSDDKMPHIPAGSWKEEELPNQYNLSLPGTVIQTGGEGRELRIPAKIKGETGFIYKDLLANKWQFFQSKSIPFHYSLTLVKPVEKSQFPEATEKNYAGSGSHKDKIPVSVFELKNFDPQRTLLTKMVLKIGQSYYTFFLYRKDELKKEAYSFSNKANFFHYDLVIPEEMQKEGVPNEVKKFFAGKLFMPLTTQKLMEGLFVLKNDELEVKFCLTEKKAEGNRHERPL